MFGCVVLGSAWRTDCFARGGWREIRRMGLVCIGTGHGDGYIVSPMASRRKRASDRAVQGDLPPPPLPACRLTTNRPKPSCGILPIPAL